MIAKTLGLALAAALLPAAPPPPTGLHECATATTRCDGSIEVPLNWESPSSERISVAFTFIPAKNADGTVAANRGGPQPALPEIPTIQQVLGPVLDRKNLLVMDPRGMGKSSPLLCPGADPFKPATIAACARSVGPRGAYFTADQASHDLDAVRRALGLGKMSYFGNSYGTLYAQAYAARYPDSLDAVFLDSSMVIGGDGYVDRRFDARLDYLDLVCGRSKACDALPGEASGTWTRLVDRLRKRPDPEVTLHQALTLREPAEAVLGRENVAAAHAYLNGDPAPLRRLARLTPNAIPPFDPPWLAGHVAFRCGDGSFPFDRLASAAERQAQAERHYERERPMAPFRPTDVFATDAIAAQEWCVNWPTPRHSPPLPRGKALPSLPILVVAGDFDVERPAEVARSLRVFPNATVIRIPFGIHAQSFLPSPMGECIRGMLRTFLTTKRVVDQKCAGENYRAVGAFPRELRDVAPHPAGELSPSRRRILAAAFATAADATARRNPHAFYYFGRPSEPGLRGGQVTFGQDITLDGVRFVRDLKVSGRVALTPDGHANATLTAETGGRTHEVTLSWTAFSTRQSVSGTFDGAPFE
ncbi:alpha/beta fold hydrolase [Nonomuraea sp. ATR24]|uniref:alpha/beta fold hydrolase n=1 Tax=Nonomuraea sp. ATR24 TaxID=1676744 RepID=UPI0035C10731